MENTRILNWRGWSAPRKGMVIGALVGAGMTICAQMYCMLGRTKLESAVDYVLGLLAAATMIPSGELLGKSYALKRMEGGLTCWGMCLDSIINVSLLAMVGAVAGYLLHKLASIVREMRNK
jgi:hypothetical protein